MSELAALVPGYSVVRELPDGIHGAWLVAGRDGSHAVLKLARGEDRRGALAGAAQVVDALASCGAPVPRYLDSGYEPGVGTWYLQEHLSGERVARLTPGLVEDVLALNALQAGMADEAPGAEDRRLRLPEARAALPELEELIAPFRGRDLPCDDVVHADLLTTQLLAAGGRLAGVTDWDSAGRGDRAQDLALLFYNVFAQADRLGEQPHEEVIARLRASSGGELFGLYLACEAHDAIQLTRTAGSPNAAWRERLALRATAALR